jgi:hypothetical protein
MLRKTGITLVVIACLLTVLNIGFIILQLSFPSKAAVGGMDAQALSRDSDFRRAVQTVVEACKVNVDIAKVQC